jgi:hypothetical protein
MFRKEDEIKPTKIKIRLAIILCIILGGFVLINEMIKLINN